MGQAAFKLGWILYPLNVDLVALDLILSAALGSFKDPHRGYCPLLPSGSLWFPPCICVNRPVPRVAGGSLSGEPERRVGPQSLVGVVDQHRASA